MIASPVQGFISNISPSLRVMAFVDGGYLESNMMKKWGSALVDYPALRNNLFTQIQRAGQRFILLRIYYYDARDFDKPISAEQDSKHKIINNTDFFELRLGRLKEDKDGKPRQKGVDTLLALDIVTKAYQNHFDVAILLAGDDDFLDIVKAVKNAGRQVFGFYFDRLISEELKNILDVRLAIDNTLATQIRIPPDAQPVGSKQ